VRPGVPLIGIAGAVALSLLAAACGGGSSSAKVAQVGTTQTTTTGAPSTSGGKLGAALAYAACVRGHGVPNFPDPSTSGEFPFPIPRNSPVFEAADRACRKLLPNGGEPSPQEQAMHLQQARVYAVCMRGHGVPRFPDPTKGPDGGPDFGEIDASTGVNLNSPQVKAAQRACHKLLSGSPPGAPETP
jgi:hypothetical protein